MLVEQLTSGSVRKDYEIELSDIGTIGDVARPLSLWERLANSTPLRRLGVLVLVAVVWELYARYLDNPLMFPTFGDTMVAFWDAARSGQLAQRVWISLQILLAGYGIGIALAALLATFAVSTRFGNDVLATFTAMMNPLPAIALLPLAMLWFGLGAPSVVFVIVHSVLWAVALNTHAGFMSVGETYRMVGQNYGLRRFRYVVSILVPAAFPSILSGLKIGWAFAWRTLIAAELVFGVSSGKGGLGWFIFENRNELRTDYVFAGLLTVIAIGLLVEGVIFRSIEVRTVRRWGTQR